MLVRKTLPSEEAPKTYKTTGSRRAAAITRDRRPQGVSSSATAARPRGAAYGPARKTPATTASAALNGEGKWQRRDDALARANAVKAIEIPEPAARRLGRCHPWQEKKGTGAREADGS